MWSDLAGSVPEVRPSLGGIPPPRPGPAPPPRKGPCLHDLPGPPRPAGGSGRAGPGLGGGGGEEGRAGGGCPRGSAGGRRPSPQGPPRPPQRRPRPHLDHRASSAASLRASSGTCCIGRGESGARLPPGRPTRAAPPKSTCQSRRRFRPAFPGRVAPRRPPRQLAAAGGAPSRSPPRGHVGPEAQEAAAPPQVGPRPPASPPSWPPAACLPAGGEWGLPCKPQGGDGDLDFAEPRSLSVRGTGVVPTSQGCVHPGEVRGSLSPGPPP